MSYISVPVGILACFPAAAVSSNLSGVGASRHYEFIATSLYWRQSLPMTKRCLLVAAIVKTLAILSGRYTGPL